MSSHFSTLVIALSLLGVTVECLAADEPKVVKLRIAPAVEPVPALKYQLLPTFADRRPGNAAVRYQRAALHFRPDEKVGVEINGWLQLPFDEFRKPETLKQVEAAEVFRIFPDLQRAARLQSCEWELPYREQMFLEILLPEVQELRTFARYVALKARHEVAHGKFDEAMTTLQVGYALARHAAAGPTLVNGLVGASIATTMDQVLLDFVQAPDAPSLYWALSFQPRPLIDPRPGLEAEMEALFLSFPELKSIDPENRSELDAVAALHKLFDRSSGLSRIGDDKITAAVFGGKLLNTTALLAYTALRRGEIQDFLINCRWPKARVEKMNEAELLLAYTRAKYEELRDQSFRWMNLPYWQASPGLAAADKRIKESVKNHEELLPYGALLLPAIGAVNYTYAKSERRLDTLRIVEALRLYAGKHDGALPKSLSDVVEAPIPPLDLVTGKPFQYVLADDGTARLTLPEELRGQASQTLVYEITVQKK